MLSQISTRVYIEASLLKERFQKVLVKRLHVDEDGAVMVEYALLIAGIAIALIISILGLFGAIEGRFNEAAGFINEGPP